MEKNWGDTPSATLNIFFMKIMELAGFPIMV